MSVTPSTSFNTKHDDLGLFRTVYDDRRKQTHSIPTFYKARSFESPYYYGIVDEGRQRFIEAKDNSLPDDNDLDVIFNYLMEFSERSYSGSDPCDWIDYNHFRQIGDLCHDRVKPYFDPSIYSLFRRDCFGRINSGAFYHYLVRKVSADSVRLSLMSLDANGTGFLTESDMERYIYDEIPDMAQLQTLEEPFYPFYVFTACRYIFFMLDPLRKGKIKIADLVTSPIIKEFSELRQQASEATMSKSWFSAESALRVYSIYLKLDRDQNGMLSKRELCAYSSGTMTSLFIDRVFQEYRTYNGEMDFKSFLDLEIALEYRRTPQALRYFWKILDVEKRGYISGYEINLFFKSVQEKMLEFGMEPIRAEDVINEIFDMVGTRNYDCMTLDDLIRSNIGSTIVSLLIDANGFWAYDNREALSQEGE